jgi:hypothetical protein
MSGASASSRLGDIFQLRSRPLPLHRLALPGCAAGPRHDQRGGGRAGARVATAGRQPADLPAADRRRVPEARPHEEEVAIPRIESALAYGLLAGWQTLRPAAAQRRHVRSRHTHRSGCSGHIVSARAAPGERAGLVAACFVVSYVAFSIPVVTAGVATTHVGLHRTALVYCAAIAVLAAVAAGSLLFRKRSAAPSADPAAPGGRRYKAVTHERTVTDKDDEEMGSGGRRDM